MKHIKEKKILVTGGSGFIGSHIVEALIEKGHKVINLDIKTPHRKDMIFIKGSILDRKLTLKLVKKVDYIYHIGGFSNINFVKDNPVETIELNVLSTIYLLDACRHLKTKPHFVYASSVYVFDRNGHLYTTSKAVSEKIIEDYNKLYDIPYTILRLGTVYGPRSRKADVVYLFTSKAFQGKDIEIHGDGKQSRNFIDVRDVAHASVRVIGNKKAVNNCLVLAKSPEVSIAALAKQVKLLVNDKINIKFTGEKRELDYMGKIDGVKETQNILKWRPKYSLKSGINDLVAELLIKE